MTTAIHRRLLLLAFACAVLANPQDVQTYPRKKPGLAKPECSPSAICFSGEVSAGHEFRKSINQNLVFVLRQGWTIEIVPTHPEHGCEEFTWAVNAPYHAHRDLSIDASYEWTAEQEVSTSPREFRFVTNCVDQKIEAARLEIVLWPYSTTPQQLEQAQAKLGTSTLGKGRLWITNSKVSHSAGAPDNDPGRIDYLKFAVEIKLPTRQ